ncbi:four-jointed box protein 1 [Pipistrellus kuhlii]|uniref:Four-jointed box kinase 1 n=1 Tax=Pipistrellus kuhlii TaxID=59472 RepID=A0A7J7WZJ6_PIPKU|nr:four-jointed box protein 1 [Pipistrellus kuhlii]KAF6342847.1 four-jointed box kinase 1 [Pipistrellus kuhlii]
MGRRMRGAAASAGLWLLALGSLLALWGRLLAPPEDRTPRRSESAPRSPQRDPRGASLKTFRTLLTLAAGADGPAARRRPPGAERRRRVPDGVPRPEGEQLAAVHGGVFWSRGLEEQVPRGFSEAQAAAWLQAARGARVVALERGGCGRSSNRLARFADGTRACVRYGINPEQIQGEALSYYLACLLGLRRHVPPLALARVEARGAQWARVQEELRAAHWAEGSVVSLTRWLPNLTDVVVPAPWRSEDGQLRPLRAAGGELANRSREELVDLVQWTDLILFDYLTANFDRLVSNLFSLQWDPRVMQRATSNLHRGPGGALVFLDNEAGLVHGYRVAGMWDKYNEPLLQSVCVFRERTARRVLELHRGRDAAARLLRLYRHHEPRFPELAELAQPHAQLLQRRLDFLAKHILHCKAKYGRRPGT